MDYVDVSENLIKYPYAQTTRTVNGVTLKDNGDRTITVNGTATGNIYQRISYKTNAQGLMTLSAGTYYLSGCPSGGSYSTYQLEFLVSYDDGATWVTGTTDKGSGGVATLTSDCVGYINLKVGSGATVSNLTFNPVLVKHSDYSSTTYTVESAITTPTPTRTGYTFAGWYTSSAYTGSAITQIAKGTTGNKTLYAKWTKNGYTVIYNPNGGSLLSGSTSITSSNLLPYPFKETTLTENGITYTDNKDGTITANGTSTATSFFELWGSANSLTFPAGTYYMSGAPNVNSNVYFCNNNTAYKDTGSGYTFTLSASTAISFKLRIASGVTLNNEVFKPSILKISNHTYGTSKALDANAFVRSGYTFQGWATSPNGSVVYKDKASVNNIAAQGKDVVTLYAVWKVSSKNLGWSASVSHGITAAENAAGGVTKTAQTGTANLTDYSTLTVTYRGLNQYHSSVSYYYSTFQLVSSSGTVVTSWSGNNSNSSNSTKTIDISGLSGSYYIKIICQGTGAGNYVDGCVVSAVASGGASASALSLRETEEDSNMEYWMSVVNLMFDGETTIALNNTVSEMPMDVIDAVSSMEEPVTFTWNEKSFVIDQDTINDFDYVPGEPVSIEELAESYGVSTAALYNGPAISLLNNTGTVDIETVEEDNETTETFSSRLFSLFGRIRNILSDTPAAGENPDGWNLGSDPTVGLNQISGSDGENTTAIARVVGTLNQLFKTGNDVDYKGYTIVLTDLNGVEYDCVVNREGKYVISNIPPLPQEKLYAKVYKPDGTEVTEYGEIYAIIETDAWLHCMTVPLQLERDYIQPIEDQTVYEDEDVTFTAIYPGDELPDKVIWYYRNKHTGNDWTKATYLEYEGLDITITGPEVIDKSEPYIETTLTIKDVPISYSDTNFKAVFVYDDNELDTFNSRTEGKTGLLTVVERPWTVYPVEDKSVWQGDEFTLRAQLTHHKGFTTDGTGLTAYWQYRTNEDSDWYDVMTSPFFEGVEVTNASTADSLIPEDIHNVSSLKVENAKSVIDGFQFRCVYVYETKYRHYYTDDVAETGKEGKVNVNPLTIICQKSPQRIEIASDGANATGTYTYEAEFKYTSPDGEIDIDWLFRVVRFGNQNDLVHMYRYVTEGTFDAYIYQLIENKQRVIGQIYTDKNPLRSVADVDDATLSYAEIKGLASGNPMVMEKVGLEIDIQKIEMVRNRFLNQQHNLQLDVKQKWPRKLEEASQRLIGLKKDFDKYAANPIPAEGSPDISVNGRFFETDDQAGKAILAEIGKIKYGESKVIGKIQGFDILISKNDNYNIQNVELAIKDTRKYTVAYTTTGYGTVNRMANVLKGLEKRCQECEDSIRDYKQWISDGEKEMDKPFPKEQELKEKRERLTEINAILDVDKNKSIDNDSISQEDPQPAERGTGFDSMIASAQSRSGYSSAEPNKNDSRSYLDR